MKKLFSVIMIFVFVFGWGAVPAKAAPPQSFYLEKTCYYTTICDITFAEGPLEVLMDGTIEYFDHAYIANPAGNMHEASTILVTASDGSTALGHISWVMVNGKFSGHYTILPGTGSLAGFHASGRVANLYFQATEALFSFTGTYFIAP